jgi:uncharacterized protein (DUF486 family)
MEIVAVLTFILLIFSSVCFVYAWYQLRRAQEHIREAIKICEDAVQSLRAGKG